MEFTNAPSLLLKGCDGVGDEQAAEKQIAAKPMWLLEGDVVGFGAILPGISGGTLFVAFGMYRPLIETLSSLKIGIKSTDSQKMDA